MERALFLRAVKDRYLDLPSQLSLDWNRLLLLTLFRNAQPEDDAKFTAKRTTI